MIQGVILWLSRITPPQPAVIPIVGFPKGLCPPGKLWGPACWPMCVAHHTCIFVAWNACPCMPKPKSTKTSKTAPWHTKHPRRLTWLWITPAPRGVILHDWITPSMAGVIPVLTPPGACVIPDHGSRLSRVILKTLARCVCSAACYASCQLVAMFVADWNCKLIIIAVYLYSAAVQQGQVRESPTHPISTNVGPVCVSSL